MKVRKVFVICVSFIIFIFLLCILLGFFVFKIPELIDSSTKIYKFLNGLKYFFEIIPAGLATGLLIGWSFDFGINPDGSRLRFSNAMFNRYKHVVVDSLIVVFIVTLVMEFALPSVKTQMNKYSNLPILQKEYKNFAESLFEQGRYNLSYEFSKIAYDINPLDKESSDLLDKSELASKHSRKKNNFVDSEDVKESTGVIGDKVNYGYKDTIIHTELKEPYNTFSLMKTAKDCLNKKDWFGAHYYAQTAIIAASSRDINLIELKQIAATAWNEISQAKYLGTTDDQKIFAKKLNGYNALIENDNLKAYYIFRTLSLSSKKVSLDPDIIRYLSISEERLQREYFFTDETLNMQGFESSNSVYFKIDKKNGNKDIYFIKGVTNTESTSGLVQYLRGLSIFKVDRNGNYISGIYTPYAKMISISTDIFTDEMKELLEIDSSIKSVPYILLNSVDRNLENKICRPQLKKGYDDTIIDNYIILPIDFNDFSLLKEASNGIDSMKLNSVYRFTSLATKYGFSKKVCLQALINRLLFPLFFLICMIFVGIGAWHGRIPPNSVFKFKWLIVFPFFYIIFYYLYKFLNVVFELVNYSLLNMVNKSFVFLVALIVYFSIFFVSSIIFLGCNNSMDRYSE